MKKFTAHTCYFLFFILADCLLPTADCFSQDIHFSQYYVSMLPFNPSTAGVFKEDFRSVLMYKDQWRSISNSYKTLFVSYEMRMLKKMGLAVSLFNDRAGSSRLSFFQGNFSLSYTVSLNEFHSLSAGLQAGFGQRSVSYDGLKWDNQFNGSNYDPSLSSNEKNMENQFNYGDFAGGLMWTYEKGERYSTANDKLKINAGVALYHLNRPKQSFNDLEKNRQYMKFVANLGSEIGIGNSNSFLVPQLIFFQQGSSKEFNLGMLIKREMGLTSHYTAEKVSSNLYIGAFYRFKDAIIAVLRFDYQQKISLGISYDMNISGLTVASSGRGGMELSLVYKGFFSKDRSVELMKPSF